MLLLRRKARESVAARTRSFAPLVLRRSYGRRRRGRPYRRSRAMRFSRLRRRRDAETRTNFLRHRSRSAWRPLRMSERRSSGVDERIAAGLREAANRVARAERATMGLRTRLRDRSAIAYRR